MPSVDVITGATSGSIVSGHPFQWTCANVPVGTTITVFANNMPSGQPWFKDNSGNGQITFTTPNLSAAVTAQSISPPTGWKWTARGVIVETGAHVNVSGTVPKAKAS